MTQGSLQLVMSRKRESEDWVDAQGFTEVECGGESGGARQREEKWAAGSLREGMQKGIVD